MSILPLPLAGVVNLFALPTSITVRRHTTPTVDDDGLLTTAESSTPMTAVVHPATGRDVERAEPGRRARSAIWIFSRAEVRTGDLVDYTRPNDAASSEWLVITSESWVTQAGHWRCLAVAP